MFELSSVFTIKDKIINSTTIENLHINIAHLSGFCDFEHFIFGVLTPKEMNKPDITIINGYPSEWRERYDRKGYLADDPTVNFCRKNISPVIWSKLVPTSNKSAKIMAESKEFGLNYGISVPIHSHGTSWGMLSLATSVNNHDYRDIEQKLVFITNILPYIYCCILNINDVDLKTKPNLTNREVECLKWIADGKTSWEISQILNISERTVIFHINNVCKKLSASNRTQAIAKAISTSIIDPIL